MQYIEKKHLVMHPDSNLSSVIHFFFFILNNLLSFSPHVRWCGFLNPGNFSLWNLESWVLESGIQLKESGILLKIGIQKPSSTDKDCNPVPGFRNPRGGIQNPRLSWIPLHGAILYFVNLYHRLLGVFHFTKCQWYLEVSFNFKLALFAAK